MNNINPQIKVSIVTPSYNQGRFIERTILSVLSQSYKNIEYIIIDGGSTDETLGIIDKYKDKIDIIVSEKDKGQSDAINKGFKLATGALVGWLNSDDVMYPECVSNVVKTYLNNSDGSIYFYPRLDVIDKEDQILFTHNRQIKDRNYLIKEKYSVNQPTSFYSSEILKKVDYVNESIYYCMDLDLWIRLLNYGPIYSAGQYPQGAIRRWEGTKTSTGALDFIEEIKSLLYENGAHLYHRSILYIHYIKLRIKAKQILNKLRKR